MHTEKHTKERKKETLGEESIDKVVVERNSFLIDLWSNSICTNPTHIIDRETERERERAREREREIKSERERKREKEIDRERER